ncbi:hypothetical protein Megpolyxen_00895 [Candidatus Megaera polyxenophila]|nr:hypothetical protein Megpolyxen_00895 [Candidatus Megaera polyxenophila]
MTVKVKLIMVIIFILWKAVGSADRGLDVYLQRTP